MTQKIAQKLENYHIVFYPNKGNHYTTGKNYENTIGCKALESFYKEFPNAIFVSMYIPENCPK